MQGFLLGFSKLVLGMVVALMLLSLAGVATARYFMGRLSVLPPRPIFENDVEAVDATETTTETSPAVEAAVQPAPEPTPTPPPTPEPQGYAAIVVQPIGLVIRAEPTTASQQLGGIDYNAQVRVLEESDDQRWILIRVPESGQEGWVKAGNTRPVE